MIRIFLAALLALQVAACGTTGFLPPKSGDMGANLGTVGSDLIAGTQKNHVTPTMAYKLYNSWLLGRQAVVVFRNLPYCSQTTARLCQPEAAAVVVRDADQKARVAMDALANFARTKKTIGLAEAYQTASDSYAYLKKVASEYGIKIKES